MDGPELDWPAQGSEGFGHLVIFVCDQDEGVFCLFNDICYRFGAPLVHIAINVVSLVQDDQPAACCALESTGLRSRASYFFDYIRSPLVAGVKLDGIPAHVIRQCIGSRCLANARGAIQDCCFFVPFFCPFLQLADRFIIAAYFGQRFRTILFSPLGSIHHYIHSTQAISRLSLSSYGGVIWMKNGQS